MLLYMLTGYRHQSILFRTTPYVNSLHTNLTKKSRIIQLLENTVQTINLNHSCALPAQ